MLLAKIKHLRAHSFCDMRRIFPTVPQGPEKQCLVIASGKETSGEPGEMNDSVEGLYHI